MAFDNLNRNERRAMRKIALAEAEKRPVKLTEMLPRESWLDRYPGNHPPLRVWQSRNYLVQLFDEAPLTPKVDVFRLTVCRVTLGDDGHWDENLSWDELQEIKREVGYGEWYGVEIYPRDSDVVNVANMRHLWVVSSPLGIGWFAQRRAVE
jgi:hypothetical protein